VTIIHTWRGAFANDEVNALHAEAFGHRVLDDDWWAQLNRHSLGWVCARDDGSGDDLADSTENTGGRTGELVGFVNVAWDGGVHAFVLDTMVTGRAGRRGIGTELVAAATEGTRAAGCEWLHVDFEDHLRGFYFGSCGFRATDAGLIAL
jgi:GNAT superfamily N-acetyltransferase